MLDEWATLIGLIKTPTCLVCNQPTNSITLDFNTDRDEYQVILECHGDKQIFHISKKYASMIYFRLQDKRIAFGVDNFQWTLPMAFDAEIATRFDGVLHFDFEKALEAKVKMKFDETQIDQKELDAKAEFEAEFDFEKKRGKVQSFDQNKKIIT